MVTLNVNVSSREEAERLLDYVFGTSNAKQGPKKNDLYKDVEGPVTQQKIKETLAADASPATPAPKSIDLELIYKLAAEKNETNKAGLKALLKKYNAASLSKLAKEDFDAFYNDLKALENL